MRKQGLMKKAAVLGLTLAMALGSAMSVSAANAKVWKFTFNDGTAKEAVAPGADWIVVNKLVYSKEVGYGCNVETAGGAGVTNKQVAAETNKKVEAGTEVGLDIDITSDLWSGICRACFADKNGTDLIFNVDLPAGTYKITVYAGGVSWNETYNPNTISIQGVTFDKKAVNGSQKDGDRIYTPEDISYVKTITLKEATTVEIKASNPKLTGDAAKVWNASKDTAGSRAFMNAIVIEEVAADSNVPKTGVISATAIMGVVALAGTSVAVVTRKKKED